MTIGRKLYANFGAILLMVVVLFLVNYFAVQREHSAKAASSQALQLAEATDTLRFQMMQNRLYLSNYLLSGDTREVERMNEGVSLLNAKLQSTARLANSEQQRAALQKVQQVIKSAEDTRLYGEILLRFRAGHLVFVTETRTTPVEEGTDYDHHR